jgi:inorganic pyrophosphatase
MRIKVFVQNEAGSDEKHYHDEKTLEWKRVVKVSRRYPFPYGCIVGTTADDGCNLDCFLITNEALKTGQIVACQVAGLMEQFEDGREDHNILATLPGDSAAIGPGERERLTSFVLGVFAHVEGKRMNVGRFLGAEDAEPLHQNQT